MRILVSGGAGFIGSNVVDAYVAAGHEVAVVDDLSSGKAANVNPKAKLVKLDIADPGVEKIFQEFKPEVLNHHAAQISVPLSVDDPLMDARTNVVGLLNLLQNCRKHGVKKVIYVSSGGVVYGEPTRFPVDETFPLQPASPYGIAKYAGELYLKFFAAQTGLKWVAVRYSNVYGPRQIPHGEAGVISIFILALLKGQAPTIFGDGKVIRDYVFVGDVVDANLRALTRGENIAVNIGTGVPTDVNALYQTICEVLPSSIPAVYGPPRRGDLQANYLNAGLAEKVLGWKPTRNLKEGIAQTVEFFRRQRSEG